MDDLASLLDAPTQARLRQAPGNEQLDHVRHLSDEAVAALALLGRQPEKLVDGTLALLPMGTRGELDAYQLAERVGERQYWTLSARGKELAATLAERIPPRLSPEEAERKLAERIKQAEARLGPLEFEER